MNSAPISFTAKHEALGYLVQSQGRGLYMILRRRGGGWVRVVENLPYYLEACAIADTFGAYHGPEL